MNSKQRKQFESTVLRWLQDPEANRLLRSLLFSSEEPKRQTKDGNSSYTMLYYFIRVLGSSSLVFGAAGLMTETSFTASAICIVVGLLVLCADPWVEPSLKRTRKFVRAIPTIMFTAVLYAFLRYIVFLPSPLAITAKDYNGTYQLPHKIPDIPGLIGIDWNDKYSDLRVVFANDSDYDYTNLDFVVGVNLFIAAAKPASNMPGVVVYNTSAGPDNVQLSRNGPNGDLTYDPDTDSQFLSGGIRVICDRLRRNTALEIAIAVVNVPSPVGGLAPPSSDYLMVLSRPGIKNDPDSFGPRTPATQIGVSGRFESLNHRPNRVHQLYGVKQM